MNLLLIPGINNTARTFAPMIAALPASVSCFPLDCPALPDVDAIAHAILAQAPARFVVGGHSFGGYVALAVLALAPERVSGLILINSASGADTRDAAAAREVRAKRAEAGEYEALAGAASARAYHPDNAERADLMAERAAALKGYGAARYAAHSRASAIRPDRTELLKASDVPKLVVAADHDTVITTERQKAMAQRVGADFRVVGPAGHMLPAEMPRELAATVSDWLTTHVAAG